MLMNQIQTLIGVSTDTVVAGGNMRRKAVMVHTSAATPTWINFGRAATDGSGRGTGFAVANNNPPLYFTYESFGDSLTAEIHAFSGAAALISVTEFLLH